MSALSRRTTAIIIFIFVAKSLTLLAQNASPRLAISTANNQSTFHLGERIPIKLSFTGPEDGSYAVELTTYGLAMESYAVAPASGWAPPLDAYTLFNAGAWSVARMGSALHSRATVVDADLNESVRFDEPGVYALTISSHRVGHAKRQYANRVFPADSVPLTSNTLELRIIAATPKWQQTTLDRIQQKLAKPQESTNETLPERSTAIEDLRYLGSPEAIALLAANLRDDRVAVSRSAFFGLVGLSRSRRDTALAAMNHLIDDPSFPVCSDFLDAVAWLKMEQPVLVSAAPVKEDESEHLPTPYTLFASDYVQPTQDEYDAYKAKQQAQRNSVWETTAAALTHKIGTARAVTAQTLVSDIPVNASSYAHAQLGAVLRASLPNLSAREQAALLIQHWDTIRSRELLPLLQNLAKQPVDRETNPFEIGPSNSLTAAALAHWYEFEPESATLEVLHQLNTPTPRLSAKDFYFLSGQTFPQFEPLWVQGFAAGKDINEYQPIASLLIRFGTGTVSSQMAVIARTPSSDYACNRPAEALAYLVRFDPEEAKRLLGSSTKMPGSQGFSCTTGQLDFIAEHLGEPTSNPVLTEVALAALRQPNWSNVAGAINYLALYGDSSARQPILDLYLKWVERWSSHPEEPAEDAPAELRNDRSLGVVIAAALLSNQGWIPDDALRATAREHCIGKDMCEEVERLSKPGLNVTVLGDGKYAIGYFRSPTLKLFEAKIDQFPQGTVFTLNHVSSGEQALQNRAEAGMSDLFTKHGMKLTVSEH